MTRRSILGSMGVSLVVLIVLLCAGPSHADFVEVWQVGLDDNVYVGVSGAAFVQESFSSNDPPGSALSVNQNGGADDDYYLAGVYPDPIGTLADDEVAIERAFAPSDPFSRIHFNLPANLNPSDKLRFTYDVLAFEGAGFYDLEISFNDVVIVPNRTYTAAADLGPNTSDVFTAAQVNAVGGPGADNVILLRGQNLPGGGNWMAFDVHRLEIDAVQIPEPSTMLLISLGGILLLPLLKRRRMAKQA